MSKSRKSQRSRHAAEKQPFQNQSVQQAIEDYQLRRAAHVAAHGSSGLNPASTDWIDLPIGSPARKYLDAYMKTGDLPDVRTADDPVAANEVWDYLENREAAGTLPLCVVPLRLSVLKYNRYLMEEAARRGGIDPNTVVNAWIRRVRCSEDEMGENCGPGFVIDMDICDSAPDEQALL